MLYPLDLLAEAAEVVERAAPLAGVDVRVRGLLAALRYDMPPDAPVAGRGLLANRAALLRAAAGFVRVFQLPSVDAPGLAFFGAEVEGAPVAPDDPARQRIGVSGAGLSAREAFEGCIGEGVEWLSQLETGREPLLRGRPDAYLPGLGPLTAEAVDAVLHHAGLSPDADMVWIRATRLSDGCEAALPADVCLRRDATRRAFTPPFPLSIGCSAGVSFETAVLRGLLEVIERDAACLWWRGGSRGRLLRLESDAYAQVGYQLARLRRDAPSRPSWLLDITTDLGVPCAAAISQAAQGSGFCCGIAARPRMAQAAQAAVLEMCQTELALRVVDMKRRERGDDALNDVDREHEARATKIDTRSCALLHPLPPDTASPDCATDEPQDLLRLLVARLADRGIDAFAVDLSRPSFGIPVVQVLCPALEKEPAEFGGARLQATVARTGGGRIYTSGIALM
jgi:ribosomal protein S12 methylthiotransferase accessory factor